MDKATEDLQTESKEAQEINHIVASLSNLIKHVCIFFYHITVLLIHHNLFIALQLRAKAKTHISKTQMCCIQIHVKTYRS